MGGDAEDADIYVINRELKSTPPAWAGTRAGLSRPKEKSCLNPPRPHGRGQQKFTKIGSAILLPLEEMIKDI